ncbi:type II secretion system protein [bacterium]|nr:type II secretion system protein [bacterium]
MKKIGFTLAEVLITLVIIGVIAAMTVPTLMNNTQGQEYKSALKKAISAANQALTLHYALEGEGANSAGDGDVGAMRLTELFMSHMTMTPMDDRTGNLETFPGVSERVASAATNDGIIYGIVVDNWAVGNDETNPETAACNSNNTVPCVSYMNKPNLLIDVNGEKKPNKMTISANHPKDQYQAQIYNQKIVPFGNATQQVMYEKERKDAPTT